MKTTVSANPFLNKIKSSHSYALGTVVLWASAYVFTKVALVHFTPFSLGVLRYLVASLVLLLIAGIKKIGCPEFKDIPKFLLSGAMGFSLYMVTFNIGSKTLTSTTGSIIIATVPIITALFASMLFQEKLNLRRWFAIFIEFIGILVLTLWNGVFSVNTGIFWMFGAALLLSGYNLTQREYTKKYSAFQSTTYSILAGTLLLLVFLPEAIPQLMHASLKQLLVIAFLGIFPSTIAYIWWSKALAVTQKTSEVSNYMFITPLLAMLLGYVVILEIPDISTYVGGTIILMGLILFNTGSKKYKSN